MKYIYGGLFTLLIGVLVFSQGEAAQYARAHDGEDHKSETTLTLKEMEDLIKQLQQIIQLLTLRNQLTLSVQTSANLAPAHIEDIMEDHHDIDSHEMSNDDHMEDHDIGEALPIPKLIIELEEHSGKTHVHIRYTDKPEDMFFADALLSDTDGVVEAIHERSGLSESEIRTAIVYTQI